MDRLATQNKEKTVEAGGRVADYDSLETQPFDIKKPTLIRFQSDGAIFVTYLKDEQGTIVQNRHIGGGGESTFLIAKPKIYSLQINGSSRERDILS